jgi:hypothetical protein
MIRNLMREVVDRLTRLASLLLDPSDQQVVIGDLAESGIAGLPALHDVLGFAVRRHIEDLIDRQLWLTIALFAVPVGVLLSLAGRDSADGSAIYLWFYTDNSWDLEVMRNPGFWREFAASALNVAQHFVALASWSWTAGFLIRLNTQRRLWLAGAAFFGVLCAVWIFGVPLELGNFLNVWRARDFQGNAAVFADQFYLRIFPLISEAVLVILPAWYGMCHVEDQELPSSLQRTALVSASAITIASLGLRSISVWSSQNLSLPGISPDGSVTVFAILAPAVYLYLNSARRKNRRYRPTGQCW